MKIVIAGSHRLPAGQAPRLLLRFMAELPDDAMIMLRSPVEGRPGEFERAVDLLCDIARLPRKWFKPEPTDAHPGRASVYLRDIEMVNQADLVLLFIAAEDAESGYSGTMHLLDKALDADRPVYAYAIDEEGNVERVGEHDPEGQYTDLVEPGRYYFPGLRMKSSA